MDLACGVRTSSTAHDYGIGLGYLKFAYRGQSRYLVRDSAVHFAIDSLGRKRCGLRCVRAGAYGRDFADSQKGRVSGSDPFDHRKLLKRPMLLNNHSNDSIAYIGVGREDTDVTGGELVDEQKSPMEESEVEPVSDSKSTSPLVEKDACQLNELRELLQKAIKELQAARFNSAMFEEKALKVSETAIALKDEAEHARDDVNSALSIIQDIITGEDIAKEAVREATMALSMAEARLQLELGSIDSELEQRISTGPSGNSNNES